MRPRNIVRAGFVKVGHQIQPERKAMGPVVILQFRFELCKCKTHDKFSLLFIHVIVIIFAL